MQLFLSLGSNLGNREENLAAAISSIEKEVGKVVAKSAVYQSEPWGYLSENWFCNQVIEVETNLEPTDLLAKTQAIEKQLGRTKKSLLTYSDRLIDIDILAYGNTIFSSETLVIPHKALAKRLFVLVPFCDIAPTWIHPILHKTTQQLLDNCSDKKRIFRKETNIL